MNLALHAGATILALALARRVTGSDRAAFLAAAIFAVHPIHVEVVANVVGRAESLGFLLAGGAWLLAVPAAEEGRAGGLAAAALLATLGTLAKENALALVLAAPLEALLLRRRALLAGVPAATALVLALGARWAVLGEALTPSEAGISGIMNPLAGSSLAVRAANAPLLLLVYLEHLAFPVGLAPDYGGATIALEPGLTGRALLHGLAAGGLLAIPPIFSGRKGTFASGLVVLTLLPVLQLVTVGTLVGDRLAYAASFGFALALAQLRPPRLATALVLGLAAGIAAADARAWNDTIGLFRRSLTRVPSSAMIPYVLGQLLADQDPLPRDDAAEAKELLVRAAALAPKERAGPLVHLAILEAKTGDVSAARRDAREALALGPREDLARAARDLLAHLPGD
ncbi:MAG TPA: glycosyltransferase family 39 protein [Planctomycetota bacterium]|nr:glycosyltransferase family 39 protein [Planctomycetota bacterium]